MPCFDANPANEAADRRLFITRPGDRWRLPLFRFVAQGLSHAMSGNIGNVSAELNSATMIAGSEPCQ
jgi:hypothetical protein